MEELLVEREPKSSRKPAATLVLAALSCVLLCALLAVAGAACAVIYQRALAAKQQAEDWVAALQGDLLQLVSAAQVALAQLQATLEQTKKCACKH
jgi:hypothetical protein